MNERRGLSQILFGFLPEQTVDLSGKVWKVRRWILPIHLPVDIETVRRELLRAIRPWSEAGRDGLLAEDLYRGLPLHVLGVNEHRGVEVERFPRTYRCTSCSRLERQDDKRCACGARRWVQWHFVSYHDCGYLGPPKFRRCSEHKQVRVALPGTASAGDLRFECPECRRLLHQGFLRVTCENCDEGTPVRHDVHRAAQVYSPRTLTLVNPPDATAAAMMNDPTAGAQQLQWVLDGLPAERRSGPTVETVAAGLAAAGMTPEAARAQAERMLEEGALGSAQGAPAIDLSEETRNMAQAAALNLWAATAGGRTTIADLTARAEPHERARYLETYPRAIANVGLEQVELLDDFPVLTLRYGYTRGGSTPGQARLRRYVARDGGVDVHGQLSRTEGLLFRLDPVTVASWLSLRGLLSEPSSEAYQARLQILASGPVPEPYDEPSDTAGSMVLTLIHSISHRLIRRVASLAGIERDAIAEYLIPEHLGFVLYAATRGDFVLGGMQALFQHDLALALDDLIAGERRCALDPGCRQHGRACVACLHIGEPSCRYFNRFLDRDVLFSPEAGYLTSAITGPRATRMA
ncbi:MAG: hypothetical protein JWN10_2832 [Solirubrobacterales bacterium]|nr:hypothetical protein [Solirubrobacterales bacterium]